MANPNTNSSDIIAATYPEYQKEVADAITGQIGLLNELKKSRSLKPFRGGYELRYPVNYQDSGNFKWFRGFEKLNIDQRETLTHLQWNIFQCADSISISGLEEAQNAGKQQIVDLLESRIETLKRSMKNNLSTGIYSDGTGINQIDGLQLLISSDPTSGTVGGIDRGTYTFNRNYRYRALTDGGATKSVGNIKRYFNRVKVNLTRNSEAPDLVVCDNEDFLLIQEAANSMQILTEKDSANVGYSKVSINGMTIICDGGFGGDCPANTSFFINSKHLFFRPHESRDMALLKKRAPIDQDAEIQHIVWYGTLCYDIPFLHGILTNG